MNSLSLAAFLVELLPVLVAVAVYLPAALESECCWYDDMAVPSNLDVVGVDSASSSIWGRGLWPLLTNDFWGTPMTHADSHKSWRPLTIASFRLDVLVTWFLFGPTADAPTEHYLPRLPTTQKLGGLIQSQPVVARVHQVAAHALVVWLFTRLAKRIFARLKPAGLTSVHIFHRKGGTGTVLNSAVNFITSAAVAVTSADTSALIAGLFFAAHPVHAESVGALVGRAELLCAICYFLALLAWLGPTPVIAHSSSIAPGAADALQGDRSRVVSYSTSETLHRAVKCLGWATVALMCKEQGALAPLVPVATHALVYTAETFQTLASTSSHSNAKSSQRLVQKSASSNRSLSQLQWLSLGVLLIGSLALVLGRLCLFGRALPAFSSVRQNPLLALGGPRRLSWWAGVGYANARHLSLLTWPWQPLCHDWSGSLLPGRLAMLAKSSASTATVFLGLFGAGSSGACSPWQWAVHAFTGAMCLGALLWWLLLKGPSSQEVSSGTLASKGGGGDKAKDNFYGSKDAESWAAAWGAALLLVPMLPASHLIFKVGFFLAERTLLVPSAGVALLASLAIRRLAFSALASLDDPSQQQQQQQSPTSESKARLYKRNYVYAVFLPFAAAAPLAIVSLLAQRSFVRSWDWTQEVRLYESALEALPHAPSLLYSMANLYGNQLKDMQRQSSLRQQEHFEKLEAIELYWRTLEVEPTYYEAHSNLATLLEGQGKWAAAFAVLFDGDQLDWDGMDGVPPASNPGRQAARAGMRHNRGLLLGQLYERSILMSPSSSDRSRLASSSSPSSLWPVVAAARVIGAAARDVNATAAGGREPSALTSLGVSKEAAVGTVVSRAAAAESAAAAASTQNVNPAQGALEVEAAQEVLQLAVEALRSAAMLSPHYDSLTEAGRLFLLAERIADAKAIFLEALVLHSTSPYPPLNLALLALRGDSGASNGQVELSLEALASVVSHLKETLWRHFTGDSSNTFNPKDNITETCTQSTYDNNNYRSSQCDDKSPSSPGDTEFPSHDVFEATTSCVSGEPADIGASRLHYALAVLLEATGDLDHAHRHAQAALGCLGIDGSGQAPDPAGVSSSRKTSGDNGRSVPGVGGVSGGGAGMLSSSRGRRPFLNVPEIYPVPPRETLEAEVADLGRRAHLKSTRALAQRLAREEEEEEEAQASRQKKTGIFSATSSPPVPIKHVSSPSGSTTADTAAALSTSGLSDGAVEVTTEEATPGAPVPFKEKPLPSVTAHSPLMSLEVVVDETPQLLEFHWLRQSASWLLNASPSSGNRIDSSLTNRGDHLRRSVAHTAASRFCRQHGIVQLGSCVQLADALDLSLAAAAADATTAAEVSNSGPQEDSQCLHGGGYGNIAYDSSSSSSSGGGGKTNRSFSGCSLPIATLASPLPGATDSPGQGVRLALAVLVPTGRKDISDGGNSNNGNIQDEEARSSGFCCVFLDGSDSSAWCDNVAASVNVALEHTVTAIGSASAQDSEPARTVIELGFLNPPESPIEGTASNAGAAGEGSSTATTRAVAVICRKTQADLEEDIKSASFLKPDDAVFFTSKL